MILRYITSSGGAGRGPDCSLSDATAIAAGRVGGW